MKALEVRRAGELVQEAREVGHVGDLDLDLDARRQHREQLLPHRQRDTIGARRVVDRDLRQRGAGIFGDERRRGVSQHDALGEPHEPDTRDEAERDARQRLHLDATASATANVAMSIAPPAIVPAPRVSYAVAVTTSGSCFWPSLGVTR